MLQRKTEEISLFFPFYASHLSYFVCKRQYAGDHTHIHKIQGIKRFRIAKKRQEVKENR